MGAHIRDEFIKVGAVLYGSSGMSQKMSRDYLLCFQVVFADMSTRYYFYYDIVVDELLLFIDGLIETYIRIAISTVRHGPL